MGRPENLSHTHKKALGALQAYRTYSERAHNKEFTQMEFYDAMFEDEAMLHWWANKSNGEETETVPVFPRYEIYKEMKYDVVKRALYLPNRPKITLSETHADFFYLLISRPEELVTFSEIYHFMEVQKPRDHKLIIHTAKYLRTKLPDHQISTKYPNHQWIQTIRSIPKKEGGYILFKAA
jgi:hypothetical protein